VRESPIQAKGNKRIDKGLFIVLEDQDEPLPEGSIIVHVKGSYVKNTNEYNIKIGKCNIHPKGLAQYVNHSC
jgi:hypothetical protein